ncbi:MAG: GAF domain-containing protein [Chloroflexota bacterium]|nr:GAF domain-containing protein [Chloroflexota bacterium]
MSATTDTRTAKPDRRSSAESIIADRLGIILVWGAMVVGVIVAVLTLVDALMWRGQPFTGLMLTRSLVVDATIPADPLSWNGRAAGVRSPDHLLMLDGVPFAADPLDFAATSSAYQARIAALAPGTPVTLTFSRQVDGSTVPNFGAESCAAPAAGLALCTVGFTLGRFPDADFLSLFVVPYLTGIIALVIGAVMLITRGDQLSARLAAAAMLCFAGFCMTYFDLNTTHQFTRLWIICAVMLGALLVVLAMVFPVPLLVVRRRPFLRYIPTVSGFAIATLAIGAHEFAGSARGIIAGLWVAPAVAIACNLFFSLLMLRRRRQASSALIRDQVNTMLIGTGLGSILGLVWAINVLIRLVTDITPLPLNTQPGMPIQLVPLLSIAYAVVRGRVRDGDRMVSGSMTYALMLVSIILGYALLVLSASLLVGEALAPNNPIVIAIAVFAIATLFVPLRTRLQTRIDKLYFRQRTNYTESLEAFTRELASIGDVEQIVPALRRQIDDSLSPGQAYIFLPDDLGDYHANGTDILFAATSPLIDLLRGQSGLITLMPGIVWDRAVVSERARLGVLNAQVIAGMTDSSGVLTGFVVLTPPRAQDSSYGYEALRFIENLMAGVGVAFERAQAVDTLERRVAELNAFSQISQGVNFTIDPDDQLELLYAQTTRLINASHFYLTLHDRALGELYHAFFVENDERLTENENRRWRLGADFFSEIVRTGQPMTTANYGDATAALGIGAVIEDRALRGWIGVPLIAGSSTIGVLSLGSTETGRRFGADTLKVLRDIGLLAATSLDKARLFNETNERARQFAALNAIAGEIVAAEKDIDRLLDLVTNSVTDLLSAEAGSLLLMTDDDSGDLEFKVVSGGGGKGLIGVRVPAGRGLVGEVAVTARPVVVNDASRDPRWGGEFTKGAFRTNSVLAVPLLTQNRVIGVLEVLNKTRAGGFSGDDVQLLTAFGAQAAVAIENARLFQMTDMQLSQRVNELETMERIDVELNRSLDLRTVADITVRSAVETAGATAGMLGLIAGDPPYIHIISRYGYSDADVPDGAEGDRYPAERGIVARVLRTRQPELVYDVRLDPNYVPSLRGALSQITLPVVSAGAVIGVLVLETDREPRLRLADMPLLQRLIEHANIAIANAQLYAEVERANASKSEFVSFVAHELKNPLASIKGYSESMLGGMLGGMSDMQGNFLRVIRSNADRMNTIVSDLNDVTKLQTNNLRMEFKAVPFSAIMEETLRPLQGMIDDKGQKVVLTVPDDLPPLRADEGRMIQVLTNLVSNAHKYSPPDSQITISARLDEMLQDARGKLIGTQVHIAVTDQGIGLSKDDLKKLFTAYFRSDNPLAREQPGTGLGLTITRGIIEGHGGLIWVESTLGVGTTFHMTCPPYEAVGVGA